MGKPTSCLLLFFISIEAFPQTVSHPNIEWEEAGAVTDFPEWSEFDSVFYVPTPSQSNDHWQDIQNAIDAAGAASGTNLVSLYYGTYTIDKPLILEAGIHDNVYIKGAGPDHEMSPSPYFTTIEFDFSNPEDFDIPETYGDQNAGIGIIGGDAFNVGIIAGYNASNNSITIYTSNTVNVGDFLRIRSNYDTDNDILMGQMNRVKNILNNSPLVIELDHDFSLTWEQKTEYESEYGNFNLRAYKVNAIKNVGISSLSLKTIGYTSPNPNPDIIPAEDGSAYENSPHGYHIISFRSYNSVIENIHSFRPIASHIYMVETLQNTVEKSFFEDAIYRHGYAGGHGYGIKSFRKNTLNLIENNIFRHLRRSLMISRGDHKNVIGYNYSREVSSQSGDQDTRGDLSSRNWFDSGNLAEGNRVDRITNDIWHGDVYTQYKNVYFRNYTYYHELLNEGGIDTYFIGNQGKFKNTDFQSIHTDTYAFVNFYVYGHPTINELKHNDLTEDGYANSFVYLNMKSLYHDYKPDFMNQTDYWNGSYTWPAIGPRLFENSQQLTQDIPARGRYCEAYNNYQDPDYHCDGPATASKIVQKTTTDDLAEGNPTEISLARNYPNPFNPTTQIMYTIPKKSHVQLTVYDRLGRKVATLVDEIKSMGNYTTSFDASNLSSGMYFYILEAENKTLMQKMTLIK